MHGSKLAVTATFLVAAYLAQAANNGEVVPLWPKGAPGFEALRDKKEVVIEPAKPGDSLKVANVHNPSLTIYLPPKDRATGAAMIVAPGGGHRYLSMDSEGTNVAEWLNGIGVAAFVLKYRLAREPDSLYKVEEHPFADAQRAIRTVRARANEWNVNPAKIGIMGFSAGGEVAVMAATRFDLGHADSSDRIERESSRPDYQILIYPGIRPETINVTKDTPPTFMLCADNDKGPSTAIPNLYLALKKAGVPAEIHIYNSGGHGFGYRPSVLKPVIKVSWVLRLQEWMSDVGMTVTAQK